MKLRIFALITLCAWLLFVLIDWLFASMVARNERPEMWGPISYFQPIVKWIALITTGLFCVAVMMPPSKKE